MGGAGVGFVYVCPLSTLVKWFPNNKGAVTGVATAGFALGAVIFKIIITGMLDVSVYTPELISNTFLTLGVIYFVMTIGGALLLDEPVEFKQVVKVHTYTKNYTRREVLKTSNFYKLLLSDLLALMPGLLIIGLAKDIGLANGFDYVAASSIVSYIAIFNAFGRFASGNLADKIGALRIYKFMYLATIVALGMLAFLDLNQSFLLIVVLCVVGIAYGSFLSLVPTIVGQLFGAKYFSANYSLVFQAYGIAALLGIAIKKQVTFEQAFLISMVTAVLGLIIATRIKQEKKV
jgi:OFA family oxalate/formate antiporter-like MFS transporter